MFKAEDVMRRNVVTISPAATVEEAMYLLFDRKISGAPVVDDAGQVVGSISESQLLDVAHDLTLRGRRVEDFMTKSVVAVGPHTLLPDVVRLFVLHCTHRLPVIQDGRMIGTIARRDVSRYLAENGALIDSMFAELSA